MSQIPVVLQYEAMQRDAVINVRLPSATKKAAHAAAEADSRSLSAWKMLESVVSEGVGGVVCGMAPGEVFLP